MTLELSQSNSLVLPAYFQILNDQDKYSYGCLRIALSSPSCKNQRNNRLKNFNEAVNAIKKFAIRGDCDDWKRCLVCGILWLSDGIAVNTHQLRLLILKCKSSINGSLQKMKYDITCGRSESATTISNWFPLLKDNMTELRQWTVRKQSNSPILPINNSEINISNNCPNNYSQQNHSDIPSSPFIIPLPTKCISPQRNYLPLPEIYQKPSTFEIDINGIMDEPFKGNPSYDSFSLDTLAPSFDFDFPSR